MTAPVALPGRTVRRVPLRFAAVVGGLTVADVLVDPNRTHVPLCPLHAVTGLDCPLCGSLRAVADLGRGHLTIALHANALLVTALPLVLVAWLDWAIRSRRSLDRRRVPRAAVIAAVTLAVVFGVVRNLPVGAVLAPPA